MGFAVVYVCCGSFLTGDLLSHYNIILLFLFHVLAGCQDQYFSGIHTMATGEHCLVIFVELLQKLEIYVCIIIIIMFIYQDSCWNYTLGNVRNNIPGDLGIT